MAKFCAWCGKQINGLDYQILVEADFLVNLYIGYIVDRAGSDEFFNYDIYTLSCALRAITSSCCSRVRSMNFTA